MVIFWNAYIVAIFILGEDVVHRAVIQEIKSLMFEYNLDVSFVKIPRSGMLSFKYHLPT